MTGFTASADFPTVNPIQQAISGSSDGFVVKIDSTGSSIIYSTFLGGNGGSEAGIGIAVDSSGNAFVVGSTESTDFPTVNPIQATSGGAQDAFVAKINSALIYSTYLGGSGSDRGFGVAVDPSGNVYVTGEANSINFPTTQGAFQTVPGGSGDAFIAKISDAPPVIEVIIDIKPGSFPNSINLGSNGTVPVAIFSDTTFDATTVDPLTVTLASAPVKLKGQGTPMASYQDLNNDGLMDLVVHVSTQALQLTNTDTEAVVEGQTFDGTSIAGADSVRVVQ